MSGLERTVDRIESVKKGLKDYVVDSPFYMPAVVGGMSRFGVTPAITNFGESLSETGTTFGNQLAEDELKRQAGEIGYTQAGLRGIASAAEAGGGLFSDVLELGYRSVADDYVVEPFVDSMYEKGTGLLGQALTSIKDTIENTDIAGYLQENYPEETETAVRSGAVATDLLGVRFVKKGVNSAVVNMDTKVQDFYESHDPYKKVIGTVKALGKGFGRGFWAGLSPTDKAIFDQMGISRGMREQAGEVIVALQKADALQRRIKELESGKIDLRTIKGTRAEQAQKKKEYEHITKEVNALKKQMSDLYSLPSYNLDSGAWKYAHYMMNYQMPSTGSPFLENIVGKVSRLADIDPKNRADFDQKIWNSADYDFNQTQRNRLYNHIIKAHNLGTERRGVLNIKGNPSIIFEDPFNPTNIRSELTAGGGQSRTSKNVFRLGEVHDFKGMSPEEAISLLRGRVLDDKEKALLQNEAPADVWKTEAKGFNFKQDKNSAAYKYNIARRKLAAEPPVNYEASSNTLYFQGSINSASKVHGGMNQFFAIDLNTGKATVVQSDRHDLFGMDPLGGNPLVVVFPPVQYNMRGNTTRNEITIDSKSRAEQRNVSKEERSEYLSKNFGVSDDLTSRENLIKQRLGTDNPVLDRRTLKGQPALSESPVVETLSPSSNILQEQVRPNYLGTASNVAQGGMLMGNLAEQMAAEEQM